jgi:hypothetical protein
VEQRVMWSCVSGCEEKVCRLMEKKKQGEKVDAKKYIRAVREDLHFVKIDLHFLQGCVVYSLSHH